MATYPALEIRFDPGPGAGALQDQLYAELDTFEPVAIHEHEAGGRWRVFFRTRGQRAAAHHALTTAFGSHVLDLAPVDVDDEDWARRSQADLKAIHVGRITVAPPWDVTDPSSLIPDPGSTIADQGSRIVDQGSGIRDPRRRIQIVIEPSMGFGTGHHATTRLCLELMQEVDVRDRAVIDVGTGSGLLAIAARMLGARSVVGVDNDPDALRNARENAGRNGVRVEFVEADLDAWRAEPADLVVANLTGAVLLGHAGVLRRLVTPDGTLIVSGFSPEESDAIVQALGTGRVRVDGEWAAAMVRPQGEA